MKNILSSMDVVEPAKICIPGYLKNLSRIWDKAVGLGCKQTVPKGRFYLEDDRKNPHFHYLHSGKMISFQEQGEENDNIAFYFDGGALFRDSTCFSPRHSVMQSFHFSITDLCFYSYPKSLVMDPEFIGAHPDLLENFITSISVKSGMYIDLIHIKSLPRMDRQIAEYLLRFSRYHNGRLSFAPPLNQRQLAELLGTSPVTVARIVSAWKNGGILKCYTKNSLVIENMERLRAIREW